MKNIRRDRGVLSIGNRLILFSVLVTLVPAFGMGWFLNDMIHETVTEEVEQRLFDSANTIQREIALWFREQSYNLNVFSNSIVLSKNISQYLKARKGEGGKDPDPSESVSNMRIYLSSIQKYYAAEYQGLYVLDTSCTVIASSKSADKNRRIALPEDVAQQIEATKHFKGKVYFDEQSNTPLMVIGSPLFSKQQNRQTGYLAIEVNLTTILALMQEVLVDSRNEVRGRATLLDLHDGLHFLSTRSRKPPKVPPEAEPDAILQFFDAPPQWQDFVDSRGVHVVGIATPLKRFQWGLVMTEDYDDVFAMVVRSRNRNILLICLFTLLIGLASYLFARQILLPLTTLTNGALQVANGDLNVRLSPQSNDEVGFATKAFNVMVAELQKSHAMLQLLSTTDSLTKLANRKKISHSLTRHLDAYRRYDSGFSILMIDIDHFKKINDAYGHQAGDKVLEQLAWVFRENLRTVDTAGRYGGEEFLIILAETTIKKAHHTAERIRKAVETHSFLYKNKSIKVSISIGVTGMLEGDKSEESLIRRADQALYHAKKRGRNQVVYS